MRRFGIVGFLIGALLLGGVGVIAYQMGVTAGTTSAAVAAGATVVYAPMGIGFGFPLFGLLFGLLFLGLVLSFVARVAFGRSGWSGGPGARPGPWGYGRGSWSDAGDRPVPPPYDAMLRRWHAEAHGTATTPSASGVEGVVPPAGSAGAPRA